MIRAKVPLQGKMLLAGLSRRVGEGGHKKMRAVRGGHREPVSRAPCTRTKSVLFTVLKVWGRITSPRAAPSS